MRKQELPKALERLSQAHRDNPFNSEMKTMKCKRCGKVDNPGEVNLSVYQNTFEQFSKGQYVFLCLNCVRLLKNPMLTEPYEPLDGVETEIDVDQFQERLNQVM